MRRWYCAAVGIALGTCASCASKSDGPGPDLILYNGKILTANDVSPVVQAVAVVVGRFTAVGTNDEVRALAGDASQQIDLGGRTVTSGLWDSHNHQHSRSETIPNVDLTNISSIAGIQGAIAQRVRQVEPGEWIEGTRGWWEYRLSEKRLPTRGDLDKAAPNNPVAIPGPHYRIANSLALKVSGITRLTKDPQGGEIWKDSNGEPNGLLMDRAGQLLKIPQKTPTEEQVLANLSAMIRRQLAVGLTAVREPGITPQGVAAYRKLLDRGELRQRVDLWYRVDPLQPLDEIEKYVKTFESIGTVWGDGMLRISGIKMGIDGAEQSAFLRQDYPGKPGYRGLQFLPTAQYAEECRLLNKLGWVVTTHAVGDAAFDEVLDAYDAANRDSSIVDKRWAVEHVFLVQPDHYDRAKRLNLTINSQYQHNSELGALILRAWGDRWANMSEPFKTWIEKGFVLAGGSDGPISYQAVPMTILWGSVTRDTLWGGKLGPEQGLSREQALNTLTINAAYAAFQEKTLGSVETGKYADLVVLSDDYMTVAPSVIKEIKPVAVIVGGKVVSGAWPGAGPAR